jgi:acetyl-CoA synthetase
MTDIDVLLTENRKFEPPEEFRAASLISSDAIYDTAAADPEAYWASRASELEWIRKWDRILDWKPPHAQWFVGGKLNVAVNCVDRHARGDRRNKAALIWEGEPGDRRTITYWELQSEVNRFANVLRDFKVR